MKIQVLEWDMTSTGNYRVRYRVLANLAATKEVLVDSYDVQNWLFHQIEDKPNFIHEDERGDYICDINVDFENVVEYIEDGQDCRLIEYEVDKEVASLEKELIAVRKSLESFKDVLLKTSSVADLSRENISGIIDHSKKIEEIWRK